MLDVDIFGAESSRDDGQATGDGGRESLRYVGHDDDDEPVDEDGEHFLLADVISDSDDPHDEEGGGHH